MLKDCEAVERAELEYERQHPLSLDQKYGILQGISFLAKVAGHFEPSDRSPDEEDSEIATALNVSLSHPFGKDRAGV